MFWINWVRQLGMVGLPNPVFIHENQINNNCEIGFSNLINCGLPNPICFAICCELNWIELNWIELNCRWRAELTWTSAPIDGSWRFRNRRRTIWNSATGSTSRTCRWRTSSSARPISNWPAALRSLHYLNNSDSYYANII